MIYIDPPYYFNETKPTDTFNYNSNFKLSSWLLFMKNRLEVARELLAPNGTILVSINESGNAYLKILMSEIFNKENFVETFIWKNTDNPDSLSKKSRASVEYIIAFEKKIEKSNAYIGKDTENGDAPLLNTGNKYKPLIFPAGSIRFNIPNQLIKKGKPDRVEIAHDFEIRNGLNLQDVTFVGEFKWGQEMLNEELEKGTYFLVKSDKFSIRFQRLEATSMAPEKYIDDIYLSKAIGVGTNEDATTHLKKMGIDFSNPKPETLISFFIKAITTPKDIVLDFFSGSGTTAAVAHKMNRQYIGIEQMDYIETLAVERLKKVIDGEQGGISKAVNWQGGGEFVYAELAPFNETAKQQILACEDSDGIKTLFEDLCERYFLKYNVSVNEFSQIIQEPEFQSLPLDEQKQMVLEMLDLNQMYVSLSEMDDEQFAACLNDDDKALSRVFYQSVKHQAEKKDGE
nr:site-specific DNA-methyltransferase [Neisseria subflava]